MERGDANPVRAALAAWNERGRLADLLSPILSWLLRILDAERIIFVTQDRGGGYRVRSSRDRDGEGVVDAERWISPHVIRRTRAAGEIMFFADTRRDRRFRTEAEMESGVRTRSILTIPVLAGEHAGFLYCDSRFRCLRWPSEHEDAVILIQELVHAGLRLEISESRQKSLRRRVKRLEEAQPVAAPSRRRSSPVLRTGLREVSFHGFRTCCPELLRSIEKIDQLAHSKISVFLAGESGTGKEVLARAIHDASGRQGPFVSLHCGAIPSSLVEIELFGHARGAFTGAERERAGLFELANGGTIFLDDVGEMAPEMQVALLRVLETARFRPVARSEEKTTDVRTICAYLTSPDEGGTPQDLRPDLYYRLAGAVVEVPPLRQRREDILLLTSCFLDRHWKDRPLPKVPPEVEAAFVAYDWPGNVRELDNVIRQVLALDNGVFELARFEEITGARSLGGAAVGETELGTDMQTVVDRAEREAIIRALLRASGNKSVASRLLGLSRKTLYRRMEKHGIPL